MVDVSPRTPTSHSRSAGSADDRPLSIALVAGVLAAAGVGALCMAFTPTAPRSTKPRLSSTSRLDTLLLAAVLVGFVVLGAHSLAGRRGRRGGVRRVVALAVLGVGHDNAETGRRSRRSRSGSKHLRDVVRRSSVAIENAVELVAEDTSGVLAEPMRTVPAPTPPRSAVCRRHSPGLADDIGHPTADAAVAAIVLVVGGGAGGGRVLRHARRTVDGGARRDASA